MPEVEVRGVRFNVERMGEGSRTVVFLHGLVVDNFSSYYFTLAPHAARFGEAILYDLRGHGRTSRPRERYTVAEMVADLAALLDALGAKRPVYLVANSFGGVLALAFAHAYPGRVSGMLLLDPLVPCEGWGAQMAQTLSLRGEACDLQIMHSFRNWAGRRSTRKRSLLADNAEDLVLNTSLTADLRAERSMPPEELATVQCRVVAIYGEESDVREQGVRTLSALPNCVMHVLPGCSHSVLWEALDEVRRVMIEELSPGKESVPH